MCLSRYTFLRSNKMSKVLLFSALSYFSCQQAQALGASQTALLPKSVTPSKIVKTDVITTGINSTNTGGTNTTTLAQANEAINDSTISPSKAELQHILEDVIFFNADFVQEIKDFTGQVIGTGSGKFSVLKPNYLYWLTQTPDQSTIIADGEFVWLYDPFIEQASVYQLTASIANTPILLLTSNDKTLWDKFTVTKASNLTYNIVAIETNSQIKTLNLVFSNNETLHPKIQLVSFSMLDATGQVSRISLSNVDYANRPSDELFQFVLPDGAYLDDQR